MTFTPLESRLVAGARYGNPISEISTRQAPYDGGHLTSFYARYGVGIKDVRRYLRESRVGSIFDLETGRALTIPYENS